MRQRREALLASVDLADRARDSVKKYSKGMLQRLGLAIALLHDPELIFMDEPTDGLDPGGRAHVRQLLQKLKSEGKTIFLNSHLLLEVERVCDRVAILDKGVVRGVGSVDQLVKNQPEGIKMRFHLAGTEENVRAALVDHRDCDLICSGPDMLELNVRLHSQTEVDQCIDSLRAHQVSIIEMERYRISLEEAFLEVLGLNTEKP